MKQSCLCLVASKWPTLETCEGASQAPKRPAGDRIATRMDQVNLTYS